MSKEILCAFGVHCDAVAGWLGSYGGEDSASFLRIGSAFVVAAPLFLAGGIALETYVVTQKVYENEAWIAAGSAAANLLILLLLWYALPLMLRYWPKAKP